MTYELFARYMHPFQIKKNKSRIGPSTQSVDLIPSRKLHFISVLSIGEIQAEISKLNIGNEEAKKKRMIFEDWLLSDLIPRFKDRILDKHTASLWGTIKGEAHSHNRTLPVIDSLIAATALQHNLILVTENTKISFTQG